MSADVLSKLSNTIVLSWTNRTGKLSRGLRKRVRRMKAEAQRRGLKFSPSPLEQRQRALKARGKLCGECGDRKRPTQPKCRGCMNPRKPEPVVTKPIAAPPPPPPRKPEYLSNKKPVARHVASQTDLAIPYDWRCGICNTRNTSADSRCISFLCSTKAPWKLAQEAAEAKPTSKPAVTKSNWICPSPLCRQSNYSYEDKCFNSSEGCTEVAPWLR